MTRYLTLLFAAFFIISCGKEKSESPEPETPALSFSVKNFEKRSALPCKRDTCTYVGIKVPEASGMPVVSDSINKKVFNTVRNIVYFGEKPYNGASYGQIISSFIASYDDLVRKFPEEAMPWAAIINGIIDYRSDNIIGVAINNYTYTGGAHGYEGNLSLLFDAKTGKSLKPADIFIDLESFTAYAEKKFREKYAIPEGKNINSKGYLFEGDVFSLPKNIFYKENGLLLVYNPYEVSAYAEGSLEVLLPYSEADEYLKIK